MFFLVRRHMTFKLRVFHVWQSNFTSYEDRLQSFIYLRTLCYHLSVHHTDGSDKTS